MTLMAKKMPTPSRAERNQQRKLEFIPVWPLVGTIVVIVAVLLLVHYV